MSGDTSTKTLIVVRHASAVHSFDASLDFERTLTLKGQQEALAMAVRLKNRLQALSLLPDLLIASPAQRTLETATIFFQTLGLSESQLQFDRSLYLPQPKSFYSVIHKIAKEVNLPLIFSHNNGVTDFMNRLTPVRVDVFPPCGLAGVQFQAEQWSEFERAEKKWLFFDYPA